MDEQGHCEVEMQDNMMAEIVESETVYDENCVSMEVSHAHETEAYINANSQVPSASCEEIIFPDSAYALAEPVRKSKICEYCGKKFTKRSNCLKHMYNVHKKQRIMTKTNIICIECRISFKRIFHLREHLSETHNLEMKEDELHFSNFKEFKKWKCEEERKSMCKYVMKQGLKKFKDSVRYFFVCHRSGKHTPKVINRKRNLKSQGTIKLGMSCTSAITVMDSGHEVVVKYCKHHYGHGGATTLIKITPQEQSAIAATVKKGISFKNLLEEMRGNLSERDHFQYHFLQKKDFQRIKKTLSFEGGQNLDMTDAESLDLWVQACCQMENSPILLYRPENYFDEDKESDEGFAIIIMTEYQKHILLASSKKVICVDRSHRRKGCRFYITVLYVMDEYDLGFPTAFCISAKVDKGMILQFFDAVKQSTGCLETDCFMSDGEDFIYESWKEVMGCEPKWLWNAWYVDTHWRSQMRIFKGNTERRGEVYNTMRALLECQSDAVFKSMLDTFISSLKCAGDTKELGKYIEQRYAPTAPLWAYCYRKDLGIGTSIHLEILHRTFRFCTREGFKKRLDKYILILMKLVRDKILDRLSRIETEKLSLALANIGWCHKTGMEIPPDNVISVSDKEWNVRTASNENFHVTRDNETCPEHCSLICEECDVCVHMFTCTCCDNLINANLCEHIHAIAMACFVPKFSPAHSPAHSADEAEIEDSNVDGGDEAPKTTEDFLQQALKKTHTLYKRIKSKKLSMSNYCFEKIIEHLNTSMEICEGKVPEEEPKIKKPAVTTLPSFTVLTPSNSYAGVNLLNGMCTSLAPSTNSSSFTGICTPVCALPKLSPRILPKVGDEISRLYPNILPATMNPLNVSPPVGIPLSSLNNLTGLPNLGSPITLFTSVTTVGMSSSVNTLTNSETLTNSTPNSDVRTVYLPMNALTNATMTGISSIPASTENAKISTSTNLNTMFALTVPANALSNVKPVPGQNANICDPALNSLTNTTPFSAVTSNMGNVYTLTSPISVLKNSGTSSNNTSMNSMTNVQTLSGIGQPTNMNTMFTLTAPNPIGNAKSSVLQFCTQPPGTSSNSSLIKTISNTQPITRTSTSTNLNTIIAIASPSNVLPNVKSTDLCFSSGNSPSVNTYTDIQSILGSGMPTNVNSIFTVGSPIKTLTKTQQICRQKPPRIDSSSNIKAVPLSKSSGSHNTVYALSPQVDASNIVKNIMSLTSASSKKINKTAGTGPCDNKQNNSVSKLISIKSEPSNMSTRASLRNRIPEKSVTINKSPATSPFKIKVSGYGTPVSILKTVKTQGALSSAVNSLPDFKSLSGKPVNVITLKGISAASKTSSPPNDGKRHGTARKTFPSAKRRPVPQQKGPKKQILINDPRSLRRSVPSKSGQSSPYILVIPD